MTIYIRFFHLETWHLPLLGIEAAALKSCGSRTVLASLRAVR